MEILDSRIVQDPHNNVAKRGNHLMTLSNAYAKHFSASKKLDVDKEFVELTNQKINKLTPTVKRTFKSEF